MKSFAVIYAVFLLLSGTASALNCGSLGINLFAEKNANSTCAPDCAWPPAWTKTNQTAAGNSADDLMYTIAVGTAPYGASDPDLVLYVKPDWFLLEKQGTDVKECLAANGTIKPARKLLATGDNWMEIDTPATVTLSYEINGVSLPAAQFNGESYPIAVPWDDLNEGLNNITITVVTSGAAQLKNITEAMGPQNNTQTFSVPTASASITTTFDVYKFTKQASANLAFNSMCNTTTLVLNSSGISPLPVAVSANGTKLTNKYLFTPMVTVYGHQTYKVDGSLADNVTDASMTSQVNFARQFFPLPFNWTNDTMLNVVSDNLLEGTYVFNASVSLLSAAPLVNLAGMNQIVQVDDAAVNNKTESAKSPEKTLTVGVQRTPTYLSSISASVPSGSTIKTGDNITLDFSFRGVGNVSCAEDGVTLKTCKSGMTVAAANVTNSTTTHNITVTFTDICNNPKTALYTYSQAGIVTNSKADVPASLVDDDKNGSSPSPSPSPAPVTTPGNGANGMTASLMAIFAALLLPALL